ncbi:MAG: hypothetical protein IPO88_12135 [Nannocystis sp.]|uniref:hypothetical protein n=1 Tax=Nannocystis sp. TaxID=1962667 RepID=UPI002427FD39|nr:hypothetical protein [Nannocystis sp.]MBK9754233.1 hypothetical protein [Nannocystis sp.]
MERWRLVAGHVPDPLALTLLVVCLAIAVVEAALALRGAGPGRPALPRRTRLGLFTLRMLGLLALLTVGLELTLARETVRPVGPRVAVLVDASASMALADAERPGAKTTPRIDRLRSFWSAGAPARAAWREQGLSPGLRSFADRSRPIAETDADELKVPVDGPASDLARALAELAQAPDAGEPGLATDDPRPLAAVLVLSDGLFEGTGTSGQPGQDPLLLAARALGVPITTVSAGAPAIRDVAVAELHAGEFAFVENVTEFSAELIAHGLADTPVDVDLRRDGALVASTRVTLAADGVPVPVRFEVAPDRVGQFVHEIAVRPLPGEATLANNRRAFVVKVLRDKVRVLHVAGRPDWDVRALRTLLGRDPNVELLSYYILRSVEDADRDDPSAELSLIAFPTDELFKEQLGSFDLVILHNFDAINHQVGVYLGDIASYVQEGGALVVIGGDMGLATGDYPGVLATTLPVDTRRPTGTLTDSYRPALSDAGRRHPITAWLAALPPDWSTLPAFDSYNPVQLAPHAASIASAVLLTAQGGAPLLAIAEPGKGRSLVLATGATWRLGFAADLPLVDGARPYDLLWLGAVRWLLRDAAAERLSLETDRPSYLRGQPVTLRATALTPSYAPEPAVPLAWEVRPLGAVEPPPASTTTSTPPTFLLSEGTWTTDALGRASDTLPGRLPVGAYEAMAWRTGPSGQVDGPPPARARRVFLVDEPGHELARVDADPGEQRLQALAEATGGRFLRARDGDALPSSLPLAELGDEGPGLRIDSRRSVPLWDGPWALLLALIGLGGEALLRRRAGLR